MFEKKTILNGLKTLKRADFIGVHGNTEQDLKKGQKSFLIFYVYELERIHHMSFWVKLYHIESVNLHMMQVTDK